MWLISTASYDIEHKPIFEKHIWLSIFSLPTVDIVIVCACHNYMQFYASSYVNRHLAVAKSAKVPEFRCSDKMPRKSMNPTGNSYNSCVLCRSGVFCTAALYSTCSIQLICLSSSLFSNLGTPKVICSTSRPAFLVAEKAIGRHAKAGKVLLHITINLKGVPGEDMDRKPLQTVYILYDSLQKYTGIDFLFFIEKKPLQVVTRDPYTAPPRALKDDGCSSRTAPWSHDSACKGCVPKEFHMNVKHMGKIPIDLRCFHGCFSWHVP